MNFSSAVIILFFAVCPALNACFDVNQMVATNYQYGKEIYFLDGKMKKLPDISIRFTHKRKEYPAAYPRGFTIYDFEVMRGEEKKEIAWSSGTGAIAPTFFEIGGEEFVLELSASDVFKGFLKEGEMIMWRKSDYEKMLKEIRLQYKNNTEALQLFYDFERRLPNNKYKPAK